MRYITEYISCKAPSALLLGQEKYHLVIELSWRYRYAFHDIVKGPHQSPRSIASAIPSVTMSRVRVQNSTRLPRYLVSLGKGCWFASFKKEGAAISRATLYRRLFGINQFTR